MKLKNLILIFCSLLLFFYTLQAEDKKTGKFFGAKSTHMPSWFLNSFLDLNEDIEDLASNNKRLILYIHQDSCPYCYKFITKNLGDKNTKNKIQENFAIVALNMFGDKDITDVDGEEYTEKEFAIKHKVQFTPSLLFFNEEGKQLLRLNGYINIKDFNLALDYIKDKKENILSYKEYLSSKKNTKQSVGLISEPDLFTKTRSFLRGNDSKKMAIFFESANCKECETLHTKLLKDETTRKLLKKIDLYQVDMDSTRSIVTPKKIITKIKDWTKELNITHTPTVIFFDEKAEEIIRIEANFKNFHFQSIVDYVVNDEYKEEKEFQRYLTKRVDSIREQGIDVNIWD
jgi:thioredoxin-related protein